MMNPATPIQKISQELKLARQSQASGNQGRARVCARRAAGWAIQEHLRRQGISLQSNNALDHIKYFSTQAGHSQQVYAILQHLTVKMEKESLDSDSYYPIQGVDLVSEAHWLAEEMLQVKLELD
jgi:hypothetical protein